MKTQLQGGAPLPEAPFPVLPLRTGALFPRTTLTLTIGRPRSVALLRSLHENDVIAVVTQKDGKNLEPAFEDLHPEGSFGRILAIARKGDQSYQLTIEGLDRLRLTGLSERDPFWRGHGLLLEETNGDTDEARLLADALVERVREVARNFGGALELPPNEDPGAIADRVALGLFLDTNKAVEIVRLTDVPSRLRRVLELLAEAKAFAELKTKIEHDVKQQFGKQQREAVLREQLKAIRKELGASEDGKEDFERLRHKLDEAELSEDARQNADRELERLESMGSSGPEAHVIRTYLEWLAALPWNRRAPTHDDLDAIAEQLDADHFGLEDVKRRILEHLAVHKLSGNRRGTILCLVGPPGVGKTSLGQSIADATGRPFVRLSLGGVRDEAEIRGHRRTYIGSMPGRLVSALRKANSKNPVMLLDEIDKLGGSGWGGWPEAALLEVLDPEQNKTFTDHYLETPFDLSEVMFVCTANTLDTLSAPLRDRLEVAELTGYTHAEKANIARRHLLPKRLGENGISADSLGITDEAIRRIIEQYTREAGVRQLDRELTRLTRSVALKVARGDGAATDVLVDAPDIGEHLGKPRFHNDVAERTSVAGVATGLAWTPVGGDILFIETSRMPGKGKLEITGKLGDVMKESARAALSYVRSHSADLDIDFDALEDTDLHIHVPAGAVPKDGPSAGVTIFTALASLLSGRKVRSDTAMTGEVTLRGRVLPVGGIKAKVLAAHRAGIRRVILPANNERDLDEIPREALADVEILLARDMSEVLALALLDTGDEDASSLPVIGRPSSDEATVLA